MQLANKHTIDLAILDWALGAGDGPSRRELGIVLFNKVISFITRTQVSDASNGYRAVRTTVLPQLVLRQEQFHTSEFLIEAIKRGIPAMEVPVTVAKVAADIPVNFATEVEPILTKAGCNSGGCHGAQHGR